MLLFLWLWLFRHNSGGINNSINRRKSGGDGFVIDGGRVWNDHGGGFRWK